MLTHIQHDNEEQTYYVYLLIDPRNGEPFYVGKGSGSRVTRHYYNWTAIDKHNLHKTRKIKKLSRLGFEPSWKIVFESKNEREVFQKENELIIQWGRKGIDPNGILTNIALGGQGPLQGSAFCKKVDQYDLFGNYIQTFSSCTAATNAQGKPGGSRISVCCSRSNKQIRSAYGFFWSYHGTPLDLEWCMNRRRQYFVYQWDLNGNFIAAHVSLAAAAASRKKTDRTNISFAIKNCTSAYGFQWTRKNNSPGKYTPTPRRKIKLESIYQWDLNGNFINKYISAFHAAKALNKKNGRSNVQRAIKNQGSVYNFQWTTVNKSPGLYKKINYHSYN